MKNLIASLVLLFVLASCTKQASSLKEESQNLSLSSKAGDIPETAAQPQHTTFDSVQTNVTICDGTEVSLLGTETIFYNSHYSGDNKGFIYFKVTENYTGVSLAGDVWKGDIVTTGKVKIQNDGGTEKFKTTGTFSSKKGVGKISYTYSVIYDYKINTIIIKKDKFIVDCPN